MGYIATFVMLLFVSMATAQKQTDSLNDNKTFIVTSILIEPYLMMKPTGQGFPLIGNERFSGYIPDLMEEIAERTGMKYEIRLVSDNKFGSLDSEGNWFGMIGELVRMEADIAAAPLTVTSVRERVVDFTKPFMQSGIAMVMSKRVVFGEQRASRNLGVLLEPFSNEIWICLFLVAVTVWISCVLLRRFHPDERNQGDQITLINAVAIETKGIFTKNKRPRSCARTLLVTSSYFFWFITLVLYVLSLFYFLGVPRRQAVNYASVEEVVRQNKVRYGTVNFGSTANFFKRSRVELYRRAWSMMSSDPQSFVSSLKEGLERARTTDYAFFADALMFSVNRRPCDLVRVGNLLNSVSYALATPIASTLRNYINLALLEMQESGRLAMLHAKWWKLRGECGVTDSTIRGGPGHPLRSMRAEVLNMSFLYLPILLFFIADIIALLMTLYRIFGSNILKKRNEKVNESQLPLNDKTSGENEIKTNNSAAAPETVEINA